MPQCEGFTCPNNDQEGGLFAMGCSGDFCDCSFGQFFALEIYYLLYNLYQACLT